MENLKTIDQITEKEVKESMNDQNKLMDATETVARQVGTMLYAAVPVDEELVIIDSQVRAIKKQKTVEEGASNE